MELLSLPIFVYPEVLFPGEEKDVVVTLIRDKKLIHYAIEEEKTCGLLCALESKVSIFGTTFTVKGVKEIHDDNSFTISVIGKEVFRIHQLTKEEGETAYPSGHIELIFLKHSVQNNINLLHIYTQLHGTQDAPKTLSFELAKSINLTNGQKIALLSIANEEDRQKLLLGYIEENPQVISL